MSIQGVADFSLWESCLIVHTADILPPPRWDANTTAHMAEKVNIWMHCTSFSSELDARFSCNSSGLSRRLFYDCNFGELKSPALNHDEGSPDRSGGEEAYYTYYIGN